MAMRTALGILLVLCVRVSSAEEISLRQAVDQVQRQTDAKILSAETVKVGKAKIYRIKVLTPAGQVQTHQVPARAEQRNDTGP